MLYALARRRATRPGASCASPDFGGGNASAKVEAGKIYRHPQRPLLKVGVHPEDIAEAADYFASDLSAESTGDILDVDAGDAVAFARRSLDVPAEAGAECTEPGQERGRRKK